MKELSTLIYTNHVILGGEIIYELFRGKVAEQKKLRKLNYNELAKMTGCSLASIKAFMCGVRESDRTAKVLAKALNIEL